MTTQPDVNTLLVAAAVQRQLIKLEQLFHSGVQLSLLVHGTGNDQLFTLSDPVQIAQSFMQQALWEPTVRVECERFEGNVRHVCPLPLTQLTVEDDGSLTITSAYWPPEKHQVLQEGEVAVSASDMSLVLTIAGNNDVTGLVEIPEFQRLLKTVLASPVPTTVPANQAQTTLDL